MKPLLPALHGFHPFAALAAAAALAVACEPAPPSQPTEAILLCGSTCVGGTDPSNTVSKSVGGVATYAWGTEELLPPAADPYGTTHRLTWMASSPAQLLVAFDTDFSAPIPDPSCPLCSEPYAWSFVSLAGTGGPTSKVYSFAKPQDGWSGFTTGHLMRVDRGACRSFTNWGFILEQAKHALDKTVGCALQCSFSGSWAGQQVNRISVDLQPHFTGVKDDVQHGLLLTAEYEREGATGATELVTMNPVYAFSIDPATGRLRAGALQLRVTAFDDDLKARVEAALSVGFPEALRAVADPQSNSSGIALDATQKCDANASQAAQQAFCLAKGNIIGGTGTVASTTLHSLLVKMGHAEPEATNLAVLGAGALKPRNFACEKRPGMLASECLIRQVYKRLYGLPMLGTEAVLADAGDDAFIALYTAIGTGFALAPTCGAPIEQDAADGYIPRETDDQLRMNVASDGCPPCP